MVETTKITRSLESHHLHDLFGSEDKLVLFPLYVAAVFGGVLDRLFADLLYFFLELVAHLLLFFPIHIVLAARLVFLGLDANLVSLHFI